MSANATPNATVRGIIRPSAQATISSIVKVRVAEVGFQEGESFQNGNILIEFDCRRQKANLASAEAQRREMLVALESATYLQQRNFGSRQDVEIAKARADRAASEARAIRAEIEHCTIVAPFDGTVAEISVHKHETSIAGKPLMHIVAKHEFNIELIAPSAWLTWLKPGVEFQFQVDETRQSYGGVVERLGAAVDPVSQTVEVYAKFTTPTPDILPGMSGTARFNYLKG